jgi:nucleotide-binding universal stress UspA family protein
LSAHDIKPILICYDHSAGAKRAIETAAQLVPGRRAIVLHVWSPAMIVAAPYNPMTPPPVPVYNDGEVREAATRIAEEGADLASAAGLVAQCEIAEAAGGGIWHAILEVAYEQDAALIVLGSRGISTFESLLLGSVSHGVAQHAHRPVLIVPPEAPVATIRAGTRDTPARA